MDDRAADGRAPAPGPLKRPRGRPPISDDTSRLPATTVEVWMHDGLIHLANRDAQSVAHEVRQALILYLKNRGLDKQAVLSAHVGQPTRR